MSTTTTTSSSVTNNAITQTSYATGTEFAAATLRARSLVTCAKKLKPFTAMTPFLSNTNVLQYYAPCSMIEITTTGNFIGSSSGIMNDNINIRTTSINSYDIVQTGEAINIGTYMVSYVPSFNYSWLFGGTVSYSMATSGGAAIVVADETIYDPITGTNKRILYVTNTKGSILPGQILKGLTSQSTATVISVTKGTNVTNSMGNLYGAIIIPALTFQSGNNSILFSDSSSPDPASASTLASAGYFSQGLVDTFNTTINYQSQLITTVTVTNTTNTNIGWGGGGGGGSWYNGWGMW